MNELLEYLELQLLANARRETIGGRDYVVADATILKVGVLNGSDGPLFYPLGEINQDVGVWNGYPVTAKHPQIVLPDGKVVNASARSPKIANAFQIGTVYNDRMVGEERRVEVWFDVQNSNRIDPRIVPAVLNGSPINVSTGIFTGKIVENAQYNGRSYTHRVRGIRPDHLAVLMDEPGACSVKDGCGVNVTNKANYPEACPYCNTRLEIDPDSGICNRCNKRVEPLTNESTTSTQGVQNVNKEALVQWLTTNCDCWKGEKGKTLNSLDEEQLKGLKANAEGARALVLTINGLKESGIHITEPSKIKEAVANMTAAEKKKWADEEEEAKKKLGKVSNTAGTTDTTQTQTITTKDQVLAVLNGMSVEERFNLLAPEGSKERQVLNSAKEVHERERVAVINKLTGHIKDETKRKAQILKLKDKDLPTLNEYLELLQVDGTQQTTNQQTEEEKFLANFFNAGTAGKFDNPGVTTQGNGTNNRKEVLMPSPDIDIGSE